MRISIRLTRQENADYFGVSCGDTVSVPMEEYVATVVASEIGNSPIDACRAQAIAARTIAWRYAAGGKTITDRGDTHQAYRAMRYTQGGYPRALQGARDTEGLVLTYGGEVLGTCSYSASNGGMTVSSEDRWGGARPWLIAQYDPWDAAAGGGRTGHGVGMSQRGAGYAASHGVGYEQILAFYYPGTSIASTREDESMVRAEDLVTMFRVALAEGWGYIWGQSGAVWTEDRQRAATREMTVRYGKRWIGKHVADCSGLFVWAYKMLGSSIYHGSNTIFNRYCARTGKVGGGVQLRPGTAMFLVRDGNRHHIGLYVGDDTVIEAKGTQYGVVTSPVSHWDEWGELAGVDYGDGKAEAVRVTLRRGCSGADVRTLQELLCAVGAGIEVDGVYGAKTEQAVRAFQRANGLQSDGVCGRLTWAALDDAQVALDGSAPDEDMEATTGVGAGSGDASDAGAESGAGAGLAGDQTGNAEEEKPGSDAPACGGVSDDDTGDAWSEMLEELEDAVDCIGDQYRRALVLLETIRQAKEDA